MSAPTEQQINDLGNRLKKLVSEKNEHYGNSFETSGQILALLYPNGVSPEQMTDALGVVRILDKLSRIAHGAPGDDPWRDIAGYGLLGWLRAETSKTEPLSPPDSAPCAPGRAIEPHGWPGEDQATYIKPQRPTWLEQVDAEGKRIAQSQGRDGAA